MNWNNNVAHNLGPSQQSFSTAASLCKVILGLIIIIIWKWHFGGNWKSNSFVGGRFVRFYISTTYYYFCWMRERVLVIVVYYFTPSVQIYFEYKKKPKQSSLMMKNASPNIKGSSWQYYWHDKDFSHWVVHVESGRSFVTTLGIIICGKKVLYLPTYLFVNVD